MKHDAFIGQVQHRAHLPSRGEAEAATRAVLETLGRRLSEAGDLAVNVASQLPPEIGRHLLGGTLEPFDRSGLREFLDEVNLREGGGGTVMGPGAPGPDMPDTTYHARVVVEVLGEALQGGAIDKLRQALGDDFKPLFAGSQGEMRG